MEFKTIVYIVAGVIWLLSRYFQKQKSEQGQGRGRASGNGEEKPWPTAERIPEPVRRAQTRQMPQRKTMTNKREVKTSREFLPAAVSLEEQAMQAPARPTTARLPPLVDPAEAEVIQSEARRIADEIRNGQMDWRRALIISELINRKGV